MTIYYPITKEEHIALYPDITDAQTAQALLGELQENLGLELRLAEVVKDHFEIQQKHQGGWVRLCTPALPIHQMWAWLLGACTYPVLTSDPTSVPAPAKVA